MLYFSSDSVENALGKEPNFYISQSSLTASFGIVGENEEDRQKRMNEMWHEKNRIQKEETAQIILEFFGWPRLDWKDLSEDDSKNWSNYSEEKKKLIIKEVRKSKLEKIKTELNEEEIMNICHSSRVKWRNREIFLELIESLILEIEK